MGLYGSMLKIDLAFLEPQVASEEPFSNNTKTAGPSSFLMLRKRRGDY